MSIVRPISAIVIVTLSTGPVIARDDVPNPEFGYWAKFKPGTSVMWSSTVVEPDGRWSTEYTRELTLIEVAADKVVVTEKSMTNLVPGGAKAIGRKPQPRTISKTVPLPAEVTKEDFATKLPGTIEVGKETEEVKIPGIGEFNCKWFKTKVEEGGYVTEGKTWTSEDVPGFIVRSETTTQFKGVHSHKTTRVLTKLYKP